MKISVVIPCYYSDRILHTVTDQIIKTIQENHCDYEIILVNDGSKNNTFQIISDIVDSRPNIVGINLAQNFGQHNAIMAGLRYVTGDFVWICSDDGQSPVEVLGELVNMIVDGGFDAVCVKYKDRGKRNFFRKAGSKIAVKMSNSLIKHPKGIEFSIDMLMRRFVADEMVKYTGPYSYIEGLLFRITQNVGNVLADQKMRKNGRSGYTFRKLIRLWMNGFTAFSIKPLRWSGIIGVIFAGIGFIIAMVAIARKIFGMPIQMGWTSLITLLLVSSGIIMLILSLIGEYIGRIYMSINNTPQYVIKDVVNKREKE